MRLKHCVCSSGTQNTTFRKSLINGQLCLQMQAYCLGWTLSWLLGKVITRYETVFSFISLALLFMNNEFFIPSQYWTVMQHHHFTWPRYRPPLQIFFNKYFKLSTDFSNHPFSNFPFLSQIITHNWILWIDQNQFQSDDGNTYLHFSRELDPIQSFVGLFRQRKLRDLMWWWPYTQDWRESSGALP